MKSGLKINFYTYRRTVRRLLVTRFNWTKEESYTWMYDHMKYLENMYNNSSPAIQTAEFVNDVNEKSDRA